MKQAIGGIITAVLVSMSTPAWAQAPVSFEAGAVMGIWGPYGSLGIVKGPWIARVSGGGWAWWRGDCYGAQVNAGRVIRADRDAKHSIGVTWGAFQTRCGGNPNDPGWQQFAKNHPDYRREGQFVGLAYTFQVLGFFVEAGPGFGAPNPRAYDARVLRRIYGQVGYVARLGAND